MRYSTNLDEIQFFHQAVEARRRWWPEMHRKLPSRLTACFDLLARERDHYYAVDAYVIDIVLMVEQTLGDALVSQLDAKLPVNLLLAGQLLAPLRDDHPASFAALLRGLDEGHIGLIGGDLIEQRSPLLGCETMLDQLRRGLSAYEDTLGRRPHVYGRRRHGLTVLHPQLLCRLGYRGVLHMAFDGGRMPEGTHRKIRWRGPDDSALDTFLRTPLDAARLKRSGAGAETQRDHGCRPGGHALLGPLARTLQSLV